MVHYRQIVFLVLHPLPTVGGQHTLRGWGRGKRERLAKRYIRTCKDDRVEEKEQEIKKGTDERGGAMPRQVYSLTSLHCRQ